MTQTTEETPNDTQTSAGSVSEETQADSVSSSSTSSSASSSSQSSSASSSSQTSASSASSMPLATDTPLSSPTPVIPSAQNPQPSSTQTTSKGSSMFNLDWFGAFLVVLFGALVAMMAVTAIHLQQKKHAKFQL
jgi:cobalamin biosynthesis Mg chelatase CobN